jgi:hypothetical protein
MKGWSTFLTTTAIAAFLISSPISWADDWRDQSIHDKGGYVAGDFHNHTWGLDWFAQSGHGGGFSRDGRLDDFNYDCNADGQGDVWENTVGSDNILGDPAGSGYCGAQNMWRWQSLQEYAYPKTIEKYHQFGKPIWQALETQVPGHEHCSTGNIAGQFNLKNGNADALAKFEYLFDMEDNDLSGGAGQGWTGKIANPPKDGTDAGIAGHAKAVKSVEWLQRYYPRTSYYVPAHIERKGVWNKDKGGNNTGYNVEHFRDFNNAGPDVAFGFEGQPGHQAEGSRGGFGTGPAPNGPFGGTYGGTGYYSATVGGLWDALLGEGRNWWLFASSDFHNRGDFSPYDVKTTADFWPGEFQKDYFWVNKKNPDPQDIIDAMRSGNSFTDMGDLIDNLEFTISNNGGNKANMGETLKVRSGSQVRIKVRVHDPEGKNHCPYNINNPSLAQVGISQPLDMPELDNVQLICGDVTGRIDPSSSDYTKSTNDNMWPVEVVEKDDMTDEGDGWYSFERTIPVKESFYCRLRGTNLPPDTPNETDADGNPLADSMAGNITCSDCPPHTHGVVDYDVEAYSDLWFYSNPIFVSVGQPMDWRSVAANTFGHSH